MNKTILLVSLSLSLGFLTDQVGAQHKHKPAAIKTHEVVITQLLDKSPGQVAQRLGTGKRSAQSRDKLGKHETWMYTPPGFSKIFIDFVNDKPIFLNVEYTSQPLTWQQALSRLGLNSEGVQKSEEESSDTATEYKLSHVKGLPAWTKVSVSASKSANQAITSLAIDMYKEEGAKQ